MKTIGETHNNGTTWQDATDVEKGFRQFDSMQHTAMKANVSSKRAALTGAPNKEADSNDESVSCQGTPCNTALEGRVTIVEKAEGNAAHDADHIEHVAMTGEFMAVPNYNGQKDCSEKS